MTLTIKMSKVKLSCPSCGAGEMHPNGHHLLIRGFKIYDSEGMAWSQCLRCAGWYDANLDETPENYDSQKGWFATS
jgi:hypothetical protein